MLQLAVSLKLSEVPLPVQVFVILAIEVVTGVVDTVFLLPIDLTKKYPPAANNTNITRATNTVIKRLLDFLWTETVG